MIPKQSAVKDTSRQTDLIDIAKQLFNIHPQKPRVQREKGLFFDPADNECDICAYHSEGLVIHFGKQLYHFSFTALSRQFQ